MIDDLNSKVVLVTGAVNKLIASAAKYLPDPIMRGVISRQAKNFRDV